MTFSIDFEWAVDEAGYDWIAGGPAELGEEASLIGELLSVVSGKRVRPDRIVRRGGPLRTYRPFQRVSGLFLLFANLGKNPEGLMDFVRQFGPMTEDGNREGEDALIGLGHGQSMGELLQRYAESPADCISRFSGNGLAWSRIDVWLALNPMTGRPQFRYRPPTLINALWFELGQVLTSDAQLRHCAHCGAWFEAGPGVGRRADAKFCSDDHRIAFNSLKRTKGG